jgi:asparagine synthase (glutamine-hydrolysing)
VYRYVALIWNPANPTSHPALQRLLERFESIHPTWTRALDEHGLIVLHTSAQNGSCETRLLDSGVGAICGRLFHVDQVQDPAAGVPLGPSESAAILASGCRRLLERYWGRYVALVRNSATGEVQVLRDPTGTLPCFVTGNEGVSIVFSDIETCLPLGVLKLSINWKYIAAFVPYSALQIRDTGLNEVTEVQAGERLTFRADRVQRQLLWNPLDAPAPR